MRIIVTGGGTGGHIYPALSIAEKLKKDYKGVEILYIGAKLGMEKDIVPKSNLAFKQIDAAPLNKKISFKTVANIFTSFKGLFQARREIKKFKPSLIIGTGGYVAGPVVIMGALMGVPTVIHEQNAFPGMTNKLLSKFVDKILISFEDARDKFKHPEKAVYTGMPVLESFFNIQRDYARQRLGISKDEFVIMTVGGSNGALRLNQVMMETYGELTDYDKIKIIHVSGNRYYDKIQEKINNKEYIVGKNFKLISFMKEMPIYLKASDLVISRAGASTINEIIASKAPSIIIPSPNVSNNHQFYNAKVLDRNGMGIVIKEDDLTSEIMLHTILDFYSEPSKLDIMRKNCEKIDLSKTMDIISEELMKVIKDHEEIEYEKRGH